MKQKSRLTTLRLCTLVGALLLPVVASAQRTQGRTRGISGDREVTLTSKDREFTSILSFTRDQEGQYTGQSNNVFGVLDLQDVKFEDNRLSYTRVMRLGDRTLTSEYSRTVDLENNTLTGTVSDE